MIDVVTKKPSAMKIMSSVTLEEKGMALNEIKFLKSLNHKNIVKFEEEYHESESVIIVMEYCRGGDLASVIRKHTKLRIPFSEETVIFWFYDLLSAMAYLHRKDILHRQQRFETQWKYLFNFFKFIEVWRFWICKINEW